MVEKESMIDKVMRLVKFRDQIRDIGTIAHVDHGKTTTCDSLLAGAGMLSWEVAGKKLALDYVAVEQERQMTVKSADASMVHEYEGKEYLINLVDTPGHVDFGGHVTRAVRIMDGGLLVVDAVEGVMPQTETVLRQALREGVKPVLYFNKVDRLIKELRLPPEQIQQRLVKTIDEVNNLIFQLAPKEFKEKWQIRVQEGNVAFGCSLHKWALSYPYMQKTGITFRDVVEAYNAGPEAVEELAKKAPLHKILLDMIIKHLVSPVEAQKYRIPIIWRGDLNTDVGKALLNCDPNGPLVFCVSKVIVDPQAGEIAVGRIFSGTIKRGEDVYLNRAQSTQKVQQILIWKGHQRFPVDEVPAGNIIGVIGLKGAMSGETVSREPITPFESIRHIFEPVVTKAVEAKNPKDLPKLIQVLNDLAIEDPTLKVEINEETGENLVSGLGELHLEIVEYFITRERGIEIVSSQPIVVYRETVKDLSPVIEGKSPNRHNKFYITVEPLEKSVYEALVNNEVPEGKIKKKDDVIIQKLVDAGMDREEARRVKDIYNHNIFVDATRGIVHIGEIMEMALNAFEEIMKNGPIAKEPVIGVKVKLVDCVLHEDAIHRGPAQVIPAVRQAIKDAFLQANPLLFEPVQTIRIDVPAKYIGNISRLIQSRRGQLIDMQQEGDHAIIKAKLPVANMFGFTNEVRSETEGRGAWFLIDSKFERLPMEMQEEVIKKIKERKGIE
ncbi:MAG: elongation factor EF-2 [Candidatus Parvarchaeota archaeon]|nr:elongation factor EF-2 [Candidatus Jingweiarchaeum tengchongense]MCW1298205.1 elongation factor EF-2 [Candidatus Jingweiarchaeum tengchongense]MCW1300003.1 elongation factor EF-2 [Candidatus Jingweiarchaeum tengchongense]MCW1305007.1 elongation factor EF-2 [Candidatus Jingweiarchaeum tengchongense]MCW1305448.1 elongation factor EF-2 [Candidatus Jingweiarchaeum tengchongense]